MKKQLTAQQVYNRKAKELGLPQLRTPSKVKRELERFDRYKKALEQRGR